MDKYKVSGMSCAACVARVEKAVNKVPGVKSCSVSLLTNSMGVEGSAKTINAIDQHNKDESSKYKIYKEKVSDHLPIVIEINI